MMTDHSPPGAAMTPPCRWKQRRIVGLRLSLLFWLCLIASPSVSAENTMIYFYSSESNINNFKSLKMEFDTYLAEFGAYEFQPFSDQDTFEQHIKTQHNFLLLLSSWHCANIHQEYALKPILVGSRKGQKYQKRLLVTTQQPADLETVQSGRIASAGSLQLTQSILQEMSGDPEAAKAFKILTVPKDIDALMSLGFGMAHSALTTESSLEQLQMLNPALYNTIQVVAESQESLLLILAVPEGFAEEAETIIHIFQDMSHDPQGKKNIKMLGLDDWQEFEPADEAKLKG